MKISPEDEQFLQKIVRDFWTSSYLDALPMEYEINLRNAIEAGDIVEVIAELPTWCLYRFLHEEGYISKLIARKKQLWVKDRYGDIDEEAWFNELKQFIENRIDRLEVAHNSIPDYCWDAAHRHSCIDELQLCDENRTWFFLTIVPTQIDLLVDLHALQEDKHAINQEQPKDGYEFEKHVARLLETHGWSVQITGKSGDQGVDIIAEKESRRYAIQCKFSVYPISNSAVQEAHSGRGFHRVQYAAVVTNSDFTRSARQLAASVGVDLLHVNSLDEL